MNNDQKEEILRSGEKLDLLKRELNEKTKEIRKLREENGNLKSLVMHYQSLSSDLNNLLDTIYESNGWKALSKYYKWRDRLRIKKPKKHKKTIKPSGMLNDGNDDLVTIIIPVYNNSKFLSRCIQSAIDQTYKSIEVLAVDDCSTEEEVYAILEPFSQYPRFKWFKNEFNSGISSTMNKAIIKATGNWIAFLDCDDWLEIDAIDKLMKVIKENSGAIYGYSDRINEYEKNGASNIESFKCRPTENYFNELLVGMYTSHLKIIHKDVFLKVGLHESRFDGAQDYDIALKTAFHFGDRFAYLDEPVYHHRIHEKQTTSESAKKIENIVKTIKSEARLRKEIREGKFLKLVSFVILSFEKKEMTLKCIKAISETCNIPHEIIVFDNGSSQETVEFIKQFVEPLENVKVHYSETNLGCPGGRRQATRLANGDYIINLDNDIIVTEGWIEELIIKAEQDEGIGAVCCKTVFPNGIVQFNGGSYSVIDDFITFLLIDSERSEQDLETALWHECGWVPGGATLFKRSVVDQLEYSTGYINAFEDNDVALQISHHGYKMYNCPSSKVYHHHILLDNSQVSQEKDYMKARYNNEGFVKSLINFYKRNQLIINDQFVHRLMNLEGGSRMEIREKVEQLSKERVSN